MSQPLFDRLAPGWFRTAQDAVDRNPAQASGATGPTWTARSGERWPFLTHTARGEAAPQLYRTWDLRGFDTGGWMELFGESGIKVSVFTTRQGLSLIDTRSRETTQPDGARRARIEEWDLARAGEPFS